MVAVMVTGIEDVMAVMTMAIAVCIVERNRFSSAISIFGTQAQT